MMNDRTGRQAVPGVPRRTLAGHRRCGAAAVIAAAAAILLAGCGDQLYGAQPAVSPAAAARGAALSANSGCVQAGPVTRRALSVLQQLRQGTLTAAGARRQLDAAQAVLGRLARTATADPVLQENLVLSFDAYSAFRAVMANRHAPAYAGTFANLAGTLTGFQRTCSVVTPLFATGRDAATATFAGSSAGLPSLKGSELVGLWARATTGAPTLTVQIRELAGGTTVGSKRVTMRLGASFRFGYLTYRVRRPGASTLNITVSVVHLAHGATFLVRNITITRD